MKKVFKVYGIDWLTNREDLVVRVRISDDDKTKTALMRSFASAFNSTYSRMEEMTDTSSMFSGIVNFSI